MMLEINARPFESKRLCSLCVLLNFRNQPPTQQMPITVWCYQEEPEVKCLAPFLTDNNLSISYAE